MKHAIPARTPSAIVMRLNTEIVKVLHQSDVKERLADQGFDVVASTPAQFAAYIKEQRSKYDKLIRQIGLKAE